MKCIICYDEFEGAVSKDIIQCHQHGFHTECLSLWNLSQNEDRKKCCPLCSSALGPDDLMKLVEFDSVYQERIIESVKQDEISRVFTLFSSKMPLSDEFLCCIFVTAVEYETKEISKYLRCIYEELEEPRRQELVCGIFNLNSSFAVRWIANKFDGPDGLPKNFDCLDVDIAEFLAKSSVYMELFWIYSLAFKTLSQDMQIEIAKILYQAEKDDLLFCEEARPVRGNYTRFIRYLCCQNPEQRCYILSVIFPATIRMDLCDGSYYFKWGVLSLIERCYLHSHRWDAIKAAVLYSDAPFLRALIEYGYFGSCLPFSYGYFADIVVQAKDSEEILELLQCLQPISESRKWKRMIAWRQAGLRANEKGTFISARRIIYFIIG